MADWTTYGKQQLLAIALGAVPAPQLYLALFTSSADPAGPPVEVAVAGYGRQQVSFDLIDADHFTSHVDVILGPMAASSYLGVGIYDDPSDGGCWFWHDETGPITIADSSTVDFPAGQIAVVRTA